MHIARFLTCNLTINLLLASLSFAAPPQTLERLDCGDRQVPVFEQVSSSWICGENSGANSGGLEVFDDNDQKVGTFIQDDKIVLAVDGFNFLARVSPDGDPLVPGTPLIQGAPRASGEPRHEIFFTTTDCSGTPFIERHHFFGLIYLVRAGDPTAPFEPFTRYWAVPASLHSSPSTISTQSKLTFNTFGLNWFCAPWPETNDFVESTRLTNDLNTLFTPPFRIMVSGETNGH